MAQCDCTTVSETSSMDLRQPDSEHSPVPSPSHSFNTLQSRDVSSDPHSATFTPTSTSEVSYDIFPTEAGDLETLSSLFELPADSGPLTVQSSETQADKDAAKRPDAAKEETPMGRKCGRCERPRSACLCSSLPDSPLKLSGKLVVFQHPHEQKRKLGTVQLLSKCVSPCLLFKSRFGFPYSFLVPYKSSFFKRLSSHGIYRKIPTTGPIRLAITSLVLEATEKGIPFFVLFPGPEAQPFSRKFLQQFDSFQNNRPPPGSEMKTENESQQPNYILLVIDGTWTQAKEMFGAIKPHIIPPGIQVYFVLTLLLTCSRSYLQIVYLNQMYINSARNPAPA